MKLIANLVPENLWGFNARTVGEKKWELIKQKARAESKYCCVICDQNMLQNLRNLHTHEFWEYDDENQVAKIVKISTVCIDCHDVIHLGRTFMVNKNKEGIARLKSLNKHFVTVNELPFTLDALKIEASRAMSEWRERNSIKWKQDLSILNQFGVDVPVLDDEQIVSIRNDIAEEIRKTKETNRQLNKN